MLAIEMSFFVLEVGVIKKDTVFSFGGWCRGFLEYWTGNKLTESTGVKSCSGPRMEVGVNAVGCRIAPSTG